MSSDEEAPLFADDIILDEASGDEDALFADFEASLNDPMDVVESFQDVAMETEEIVDEVKEEVVRKIIKQTGSKFAVNVGRNKLRTISSDEEEVAPLQKTKAKYTRPVISTVASGPFGQGPSTHIQSELPAIQRKSETMGFDRVKSITKDSGRTLQRKTQIKVEKEKESHPIPNLMEFPLHEALIEDSNSDNEEYLTLNSTNPSLPIEVDSIQTAPKEETKTDLDASLYLFQFPNILTHKDNEGRVGKLFVLKNGKTVMKIGKIVYSLGEGVLGMKIYKQLIFNRKIYPECRLLE